MGGEMGGGEMGGHWGGILGGARSGGYWEEGERWGGGYWGEGGQRGGYCGSVGVRQPRDGGAACRAGELPMEELLQRYAGAFADSDCESAPGACSTRSGTGGGGGVGGGCVGFGRVCRHL